MNQVQETSEERLSNEALAAPIPAWQLDAKRDVVRANLMLLWAFGVLEIGKPCDPEQVVGCHAYAVLARAIEKGRLRPGDPANQEYILSRLRPVLGTPDEEHHAVQQFLDQVFAVAGTRAEWEEKIATYYLATTAAGEVGHPFALDHIHYSLVLHDDDGRPLYLLDTLRRLTNGGRLITYGERPGEPGPPPPEPPKPLAETSGLLTAAATQIREAYPDVPYIQERDRRSLTQFFPATSYTVSNQQPTMPREYESRRTGESPAPVPVAHWQPGEPFPPEIGATFVAPSEVLEHPVFGAGFAWDLQAGKGVPTRLELFPERRQATLRFVDRARELQRRDYLLDSVGVEKVGDRATLTLISASAEEERGTILRVYPSGEFDESFRYITAADWGRRPETLAWPAPVASVPVFPAEHHHESASPPASLNLTVNEAARRLDIHPANVVRALQDGRLLGQKVGNRWRVDAASVEQYQRRKPGPRPEE